MYFKINKKLGITENYLRILCLFTNCFERSYYIREIQKMLGISPRTAQLALDNLEGKGVLESQTRGKIRMYRLRANEIAMRYIMLAEYYKTIIFFETYPLIKEIVEKIQPFVSGIGIVFGSYAKGTATKESDLDVFIAGKCETEKIASISKRYGIDISVKRYSISVFRKNLHSDFLLKEILKNHIIFLNTERFIRMVLSYE